MQSFKAGWKINQNDEGIAKVLFLAPREFSLGKPKLRLNVDALEPRECLTNNIYIVSSVLCHSF